jgi:putative Holliday junction resolvase
MKYLAIDHGTEKMGFAISDDYGKFAAPLVQRRINGSTDVDTALSVINEHKPDKIIVGFPLGLAGKPTKQSKIVENFIRITTERSGIEIIPWEESYSSEYAKVVAKAKNSKQIDSESARLLLQEYLDFKHSGI